MKHRIYSIFFGIAFLSITQARAVELRGSIGIEQRGFWNEPQYKDTVIGQTGGQNYGNEPNLLLEPELFYQTEDYRHTFTGALHYRYDPSDPDRTHFDVRQLDWVYAEDGFELKAGIGQEFWGVTETRHPVDIINQTDMLEGVDGEDKLGQPMIQIATFRDWGDLRFYVLPYFRIRQTVGANGRIRGPLIVRDEDAEFSHPAGKAHPDIALRYSRILDEIDLGISYFHGTSREPTYHARGTTLPTGSPACSALPAFGGPCPFPVFAANHLIPQYDIIDQLGVDLQYTDGAMLWKFEGIARAGHGRAFFATTAGFEYSFFDFDGEDTDLGLLAEYHFDGREKGTPDDMSGAPVTPFNNDIFLGMRIGLNDVQTTEFLGGAITDLDHQTTNFFIEASRRFGDRWRAEVEIRISTNADRSDPAYFVRKDNFGQFNLRYYF